MTADQPCRDCGNAITIGPARHGNGQDREGYYRLHARHQVRCEGCARRVMEAHLSAPGTRARLASLQRHGLRAFRGAAGRRNSSSR